MLKSTHKQHTFNHMQKILRTICIFAKEVTPATITRLNKLAEIATQAGFQLQTKRLCSPSYGFTELEKLVNDPTIFSTVGTLSFDQAKQNLPDFYNTKNLVFFNVDLTNEDITTDHANLLFNVMKNKAEYTFRFTYTFNNALSSPYFPSAAYEKDGFSVGLQPTDLSENCNSIDEWLANMKGVWEELMELFGDEADFLGIDSSIAPLFKGSSSMVDFIKRIRMDFSKSTTTDTYLKITKFIKEENPKMVGLSGLMFPALEDFGLAEEYEAGNFSIERNIYLSLHSGLGIDTYPVGVDEEPERLVEVLKTVQGLSNKYGKPLSARFVSNGKAKIGEMSDFKNEYLKDVVVRGV